MRRREGFGSPRSRALCVQWGGIDPSLPSPSLECGYPYTSAADAVSEARDPPDATGPGPSGPGSSGPGSSGPGPSGPGSSGPGSSVAERSQSRSLEETEPLPPPTTFDRCLRSQAQPRSTRTIIVENITNSYSVRTKLHASTTRPVYNRNIGQHLEAERKDSITKQNCVQLTTEFDVLLKAL